MSILSNLRRWMGAMAGAAALALVAGADEPTKTVDAGGLSFKAPESWKSMPTRSPMRRAQLKVEPVAGEDYPAVLVVYAFPGGAGTVEANLARWQGQFKDAAGNLPKIESKTVKGKNTEVTRVETAGHYKPGAIPGMPAEPERENARMLVAIVATPRVGYFLKMVGPDKTMNALKPAFEALIASLEVKRTDPEYSEPNQRYMPTITIICARCTLANLESDRFCAACGLPLGGVQADAGVGVEALGTYEAPEPADPDVERLIRTSWPGRALTSSPPAGAGSDGSSRLDRKQAVYLGPAGTDSEGRALLSLVSICGPANDRDCRILLKHNARMTDGHFAIRVLRGEEYFVVIENLAVETAAARFAIDHQGVAAMADGLEDRLSRGRDLY